MNTISNSNLYKLPISRRLDVIYSKHRETIMEFKRINNSKQIDMNSLQNLPYDMIRYISLFLEDDIKYAYNCIKENIIYDALCNIVENGDSVMLINNIYNYLCLFKNSDPECYELINEQFSPWEIMHYDYTRTTGSRKKEWFWDDSGTDHELYIQELIQYLYRISRVLNNTYEERLNGEKINYLGYCIPFNKFIPWCRKENFKKNIRYINKIYSYIIITNHHLINDPSSSDDDII